MKPSATVVMLVALSVWASGAQAACELTLADGRVVKVSTLAVGPHGLTVTVGTEQQFYAWDDLEANTAYRYRAQELGTNAQGHLELARFCLERGLVREAFTELDGAEKASPELKDRIARLRKYDASVRSGAHIVIGPGMVPEAETDPAKILHEQRSRGKVTAKLLGVPVGTAESDHFIIHTTFALEEGAGLTRLAEKLYRRFSRTLSAGTDDEFVWTGKVVIYAFARREEFTDFSKRAHLFPGSAAGAYFRAVGRQAELVVPKNGNRERFEQDLTHEATHLLLHFYRKAGRVPNWLHEGLAQSFEFKAFPRAPAHVDSAGRVARDLARNRMMKLSVLLEEDRPNSASDLAGYAYAWSFVEYLLKKRRSQLIRFIRELKDGTAQDEAARKTFGLGLTELDTSWVRHVRRTY